VLANLRRCRPSSMPPWIIGQIPIVKINRLSRQSVVGYRIGSRPVDWDPLVEAKCTDRCEHSTENGWSGASAVRRIPVPAGHRPLYERSVMCDRSQFPIRVPISAACDSRRNAVRMAYSLFREYGRPPSRACCLSAAECAWACSRTSRRSRFCYWRRKPIGRRTPLSAGLDGGSPMHGIPAWPAFRIRFSL
jgi:hypothetical protein